MNNQLMFGSNKDTWATPWDFYNKLNAEFHFTLDPCCEDTSRKVMDNYYTKETNGLDKSWKGETVFMNPPYGRVETGLWMKKAYEESLKPNTTVVSLIPARTDTKFWHNYCMNASEIRFVEGRLKFGNSKDAAPFPSAVIVMNGDNNLKVSSMKNIKAVPIIQLDSTLLRFT